MKLNMSKPRYITIRIQYYPISNWVWLIAGLASFCLLLFISFSRFHTTTAALYTKPLSPHVFPHFILIEKNKVNSSSYQSFPKDEVVFHGPRNKKEIALTFDADMTPGMLALLDLGEVSSYYNQAVIDILNQTQTKATLFLTGMWIERYPNATREFAANPLFELASHSYSHPGFDGTCYGLTPLSDTKTIEEITKTQDLLFSFTKKPNRFFRFPGGCYSQQDVRAVSSQGLQVIQWDSVGQDGFNEDPRAIEQNVLSSAQNGSIIVLHMHGGPNAPKTAEALPRIIATLKERGFSFVTLSELLDKRFYYSNQQGPENLRSLFLTALQ